MDAVRVKYELREPIEKSCYMTVSVSVIIPCLNEYTYIENCLDSVINQNFPDGWQFEIIVVDGMSDDGTREVLRDYQGKYEFIRVIDNPQRIIPVALNLGIKSSNYEFILRMDSHCTYGQQYIYESIKPLLSREAENVGGLVRTVGITPFARAVALASSSRFGVGNAYHRYLEEKCYVDTVSFGAWRRQTLLDIGMFNEYMLVNQDYEFNIRLRAAGGRLLLNPTVKCDYYARSSPYQLARQYIRYGFWRARTSLMHPGTLRPRQMVAPVFVIALILSSIISTVSLALSLVVPISYLAVNLAFTMVSALSARKFFVVFLPFIFLIIHVCWGCGFLAGRVFWSQKLKGTSK